MLQLLYANVGKQKAFKKVMFCLSKRLSDNGYASSLSFNESFSVATIHLDSFTNTALLGSTLTMINSIISLLALEVHDFDCSNIYPDIVRFCKNS